MSLLRLAVPVLVILLSALGPAMAAPPPALPLKLGKSWRALDDSLAPRLQRALETRLNRDPARRAMAAGKKLAVGLVDLRDPAKPRFARVNGDTMLYAASLPKIALLLAAYAALDDGSLRDSPELQADLTNMIRTSSNRAATAVIDRLGFEKIAATLTAPRFRLYDRSRGGGLWVGKRFAKQGRRVGDPMKNISHAATARQVCRFYYQLATGKLLGPERSRQMLGHLSAPGIHHGFVGVLDRRAPAAKLYRKSGTWSIWRADSALVWGPERRYILVGLVEGGDGAKVLRSLVDVAEGALRDAP